MKHFNSSFEIKNEETLVITNYEYFQSLTKLLNEYNQTEEKRFILKFSIFAQLLKYSLPSLSKKYDSLSINGIVSNLLYLSMLEGMY